MKRAISSILFTPVTVATLLAGAVVFGALILAARRRARKLSTSPR